mmetsp:Transcript_48411/g.144584  ORF Transcript_48411/g.144584 Transcript_48411/m.144584 type:complete len:592 (-) Transcript_48411:49-1824(-)
MDGSPVLGLLRSWRDPWGFIVCPGAFEGDLFAHRENFVSGVPAGDLTGASVQFRRAIDGKGRPHAAEILVLQLADPSTIAAQAGIQPGEVRRASGAPAQGVQAQPATRASAEKLAAFAGQRLRGKIRSWKEAWGFVTCPKFEGDLFVHKQNLRFDGEPVAGKPVSFAIAVDKQNRVAATEVTEPTPGAEDFEGAGPLSGRIRSWKNEWGFIVAPDHFEGDLFCHQEHVHLDVKPNNALEMAQALVNRTVSFEVMVDAKGRSHAAKVFPLEPITVIMGGATPMLMPNSTMGVAGGCAGPSVPSQILDNGEVLTGMLRSWKEAWGFIVAPDRFEGDLFVHKEAFVGEIPGPSSVGRPVQFQRATDQRGRTHAAQVSFIGAAPAAIMAPQMALVQADPFTGRIEGVPATAVAQALPVQTTNKYDHCMGITLTGSCRSWKGEWGFVVSESFEGDLFAHKMNIQNGAEWLTPGVALSFEVAGDSRGRATAQNIRVLSEAKDWAGSGVQLQGTVRSYREPWGFLVSPGSFVSDLFFHVEHVSAALRPMLQGGMEVAFRVEQDPKGRCTGTDIQISTVKRSLPPGAGAQGQAKRPRVM